VDKGLVEQTAAPSEVELPVAVPWLVVGLSLGSALSFAVSTNLKHSSAGEMPEVPRLRAGMLARFVAATLRHQLWLAGLLTDLVGLSLQDRYLYTAEAIRPTRVRRLARPLFEAAANEDGELRGQLYARLCAEMTAAHEQVVLLARKNAEERVSSFLLALVRRMRQALPPTRVVDLPMTRLDMADYLGLTIETVSRVMTRLQMAGVIEQTGRHVVTVLRPMRLARLAGVEDETEGPTEGALNAH